MDPIDAIRSKIAAARPSLSEIQTDIKKVVKTWHRQKQDSFQAASINELIQEAENLRDKKLQISPKDWFFTKISKIFRRNFPVFRDHYGRTEAFLSAAKSIDQSLFTMQKVCFKKINDLKDKYEKLYEKDFTEASLQFDLTDLFMKLWKGLNKSPHQIRQATTKEQMDSIVNTLQQQYDKLELILEFPSLSDKDLDVILALRKEFDTLLEELKTKVKYLTNIEEEANSKIKDLEKEIREIPLNSKEDINSCIEKAKKLGDFLEVKNNAIDRLKNLDEAKENVIGDMKAQISSMKSWFPVFEIKEENLEAKIKEAEQGLKSLKQHLPAAIENVKNASSKEEVESAVKGQNRELETAEQSIELALENVEDQMQLATDIAKASSRIEKLIGKKSSLESWLSSYQTTNPTQTEPLKDYLIQEKESLVNSIKSNIPNYQNKLTNINNIIIKASNLKENAGQVDEKFKRSIEELKDQMNSADETLGELNRTQIKIEEYSDSITEIIEEEKKIADVIRLRKSKEIKEVLQDYTNRFLEKLDKICVCEELTRPKLEINWIFGNIGKLSNALSLDNEKLKLVKQSLDGYILRKNSEKRHKTSFLETNEHFVLQRRTNVIEALSDLLKGSNIKVKKEYVLTNEQYQTLNKTINDILFNLPEVEEESKKEGELNSSERRLADRTKRNKFNDDFSKLNIILDELQDSNSYDPLNSLIHLIAEHQGRSGAEPSKKFKTNDELLISRSRLRRQALVFLESCKFEIF